MYSIQASILHPAVRQIREACVADHVAVLPAITRQPGFLWFVVRDSCVERLFVCTSASSYHDELALVRPAVPLQEDTRQQPQLRAAVGAALLLDTCSLLQPAQFFVRKRSSEKSEVLVTVSVLEAKSCGAETVPELVTSPQPVDAPPLVAVKVQPRLSQSSGPAEAAPVMVSVAPVSAPVAAKLAAVAAPEAVSVPVDTSPTVVKFPALAVLLMVSVLPVIGQGRHGAAGLIRRERRALHQQDRAPERPRRNPRGARRPAAFRQRSC